MTFLTLSLQPEKTQTSKYVNRHKQHVYEQFGEEQNE